MSKATSARTSRGADHRPPLTRADLHVHTRASSRSATGWLKALGVAESYSEPEHVHDLAMARGMNLVAITDHDTIDGAIELVDRGFKDVIIGEEVTTRFADTGCLLHVLVWMLTPSLHDEIAAFGLREDAVALARWLRERRLPHALAHPLFDMNRKLCIRELERCALLFGGFEAMNGGHTTAAHRTAFLHFLESFDSTAATERHGINALWPQRWLTAGSDDHGLINIGRAWTAVEGRRAAPEFFERLTGGGALIGGRDACAESLAHQFIGVASRFLLDPPRGARDSETGMARATRSFFNSLAPMRHVFQAAAAPCRDEQSRHSELLEASRRACETAAAQLPTEELAHGSRTPIAAIKGMRACASLIASQSAYVVATAQHQRERALLRDLAPRSNGPLHVGLFVDALDHVSGVSRFVLDLARESERAGRRLTVFTCAAPDRSWPACVRALAPVGDVATPGYAGVRLGVPWAPSLIQECAERECDVIHVSTPGPVGMVGALAASILKRPLLSTHHTNLEPYARHLLGSDSIGAMTKQLLIAWYARCDRVLARSAASAQQLHAMGIPQERIGRIAPGIDLSRFNPRRRDPQLWRAHGVTPQSVKALYVGRISREKNLEFLANVWMRAHARLRAMSLDAEWIVIGDGPWRGELQNRLAETGCHFLGVQRGAALADLYASSDVLLFPSTTETLGQVVMEAQASGLPALVADAGGPRDIVEDGVTGRVLSAQSPTLWVDAIVQIIANAPQRRGMSAHAARHALRFGFEASFQSFWRAHEDVVHQRAADRPADPDLIINKDSLRRMVDAVTSVSA